MNQRIKEIQMKQRQIRKRGVGEGGEFSALSSGSVNDFKGLCRGLPLSAIKVQVMEESQRKAAFCSNK